MADCIAYSKIPYYSKLIIDYLSEKEELQSFYNNFPRIQNFKKQLDEKGPAVPEKFRTFLHTALKSQYKSIGASKKTLENIDLLKKNNTFTITTGHQLNLFTGPLYFLYKIITVIKLSDELKQNYPDYNFVPVFWMAGEDHDFEEINYFNFNDRQIWWDSDQTGAVGEFSTQGLNEVYDVFKHELNTSDHAEYLSKLFKKAYVEHDNLTEATRYLANTLFKDYGLVIIGVNDRSLKQLFLPYIEDELFEKTAYKSVGASAEELADMGYEIQVNPREINLFYIKDGIRKRIIEEAGDFFVNETDIRFSKEEIVKEFEDYPERFSPNAIMRPLYQEVILPNLCYVGGSGELAYWLELKDYFDTVNVKFPSLLLRNSALILTEKQDKKRQNLGLSYEDLFLEQEELISKQTRRISEIPIDFSPQKEYLENQFKDLYGLAEKTDKSFIGAVAAQEKKQKNGLDHLEKRLLTAQKHKLHDELERSIRLQDELFPRQNLQERIVNFSEFYEKYGEAFIRQLFEELKPLKLAFNVVRT